VVKQLDQVPNRTATVKAYRIKQADPEAIFTSLSKTFNKNKQFIIQFQPATSSVHLIATAKNHVIFQELMKELDQPDTEGTVVRVFPFDEARITAEQVVESLDESLTQSLSLQVNEKVNSLIARGGEASQKKLQIAIDAIVKQLPMPARPTTQVYALTLASAEAVQEALSPLVTSGSVVADPASGSILVTANEEEQKRVAGVVKQLDQVPTQTPTVRAYRIKNTDPHAVFRSVNEAFRDNLDFTFNFQDATRSIYLVATPRNHALFKTLLEELDQPGPPQTPRNAKVYSLENVDGNVATSILNTLFVGQNIQIQFNTSANALVIIAADHQHAAVAQALKEMSGVERILEVFPLQYTDPLSIETAVLNLYEGSPPGLAPVVSSDYDTQRIFVRGTKTQVDRIRQLLIRLGEPVKSSAPAEQKGGVRTIPFHGSTTQAVEQMEKVWNKLRKNRIQVVIPSQPGKKPLDGKIPGTPVPPATKTPPGKTQPDEKQGTSSDLDRRATFPVAWQDTTRKQEPKAAQAPPQDQNATPASIVVVPGAGQITIASSDLDALDEMEKLLRAISQRSGGPTPNTTFSVFFLRNTGAKEAETLLGTLLEQLPVTRNGVGPIAAVADKRLNALVVHGSRKDRQIIQELLEVLDTAETLTQTMIPIPTLVPLKNTQANRVLNILRNVYRTQLSSTGGRKQVSIPEGVSDDVAALLQQMNASSAGPILSLDVDEKTNSIVIRALPDLSREVQVFIKELDTSARESSQRRVQVIQLENTRSDRMLQLLQQFLDRPSRSPSTTTPVSPAAND
jgi:type II secretory pathway component GspD/PulD (secretin)